MAASRNITTQYTSAEFVESAGAILFKVSTKQICLVYSPEREEWLLPKGRRNIGESRDQGAIREVQEETGFPCRLLPVTLRTRCTPDAEEDGFTPDVPRLYKNVIEPFMLSHRVLHRNNGIKLIWWYIGAVNEDAQLLKGEETYSAKLFDYEEAITALTFQTDRDVVVRAIEVYEETYGGSSP